MTTKATATVVVVARDRWAQAPATLDHLLARTDRRHPVVVVDGGAGKPVAAVLDRQAATGRIRVARRGDFLASNEARNIGADGARTEWIAFVENDVVLSDGWLDTLLDAGDTLDATTVYPAYLQPGPDGPIVHGLGCELDVEGEPGARRIREHQHQSKQRWAAIAPETCAAERILAEPHALAVRREFLERLGGLDENYLSWFDHIDLALHHRRLDATAWLVPQATCTYLGPPPVSMSDIRGFTLRWGNEWFERSLDHLCATWDLDRNDSEWEKHVGYRDFVRRGLPTSVRRFNIAVEHAAQPVARLVAKRWGTRRATARRLAHPTRERHIN